LYRERKKWKSMVESKDFGNYHGQRKDLGRCYEHSILGMGNSKMNINIIKWIRNKKCGKRCLYVVNGLVRMKM
jgi:hypothetical protein